VQIFVSFIAILASIMQLAGLDVRDLFGARPTGASVEAFPFHVIRDFDELLDHLFPDPKATRLSDRSIRFLPRIAGELDAAFRQHRHILVRGRSKTGKTREIVELLRRWCYTGPTILLAKHHVGLHPPYQVPANLPIHNLVLLFDDVDRYCGDAGAIKRLDQTIDFFTDLCHDPEELRVIATARQEPEFWNALRYDVCDSPWDKFQLLSLPALSTGGARRLIDSLAQDLGIAVDPAVANILAIKNDGTFLNLVLSFRSWLHEGVKRVTHRHAEDFEGGLFVTWRRRYRRLAALLLETEAIYAAAGLLQRLDIPLRPSLIAELATEMSLSRATHFIQGTFHWIIWHILYLSPRLDCYRDPHRRRRLTILYLITAPLVLYALLYLFYCVAPINFQIAFSQILTDQFWLLIIPVLMIALPETLSLILRLFRGRRLRRVRTAIEKLTETEIPLHGQELRPYEGQFEGNGVSRAWSLAFFSGRGEITTCNRPVASRLAAFYCKWAEDLRAAGELGPAHSLARIACDLAPDHPKPPFTLGTLWYAQGNFRRALVAFGRSRALNATNSEALALERSAWCLYQLEEFEQAEMAAKKALDLVLGLPAAQWARGLALLHQGHIESGLDQCRQAAEAKGALAPDLAKTLHAAIATARSQGWADEVDELLEQSRSNKEKLVTGWHKVSWNLNLSENLAWIIALGVFLLGMLFSTHNLAANANLNLQVSDVMLTLYPRAPLFLYNRGVAYQYLADYEQAIADYTQSIRRAPGYAGAYHGRGSAYHELGEYEQAIADYTQSIRCAPDDAGAYYGRGVAYYYLGEYEQAVADYTEAIRLDPDDADAYYGRGTTYKYLSQFELAHVDFKHFLELSTDPYWRERAQTQIRELESAEP